MINLNYRDIIKIMDLLIDEEDKLTQKRYDSTSAVKELQGFGEDPDVVSELDFVKNIREKLENEISKVTFKFSLGTEKVESLSEVKPQ